MGPLIWAQQPDRVRGFREEVEVAFTGSAPDSDGFWLPPSVVLIDSPEQRIRREEVFAAVAAPC